MSNNMPEPQMTETTGISRLLPPLRSRWWTLLLGLSLMLNLLIGGLAVGRFVGGGPMERMMGASYVQLIPRSFFADLTKERRRELLDIIRNNRDELRDLRAASDATSLALAADLEKQPFSATDVQNTVSKFSTGTESLAARGGSIVVEIVSMLTPDERQLLARSIRERADRRKKK